MKSLITLLFSASMLLAGEPARPLDTPDAWTFADPGAWVWSKDEGRGVITLQRQQKFQPTVRSPFNLAWLKITAWKSFTLTVEAQLTKFDAGNNDLCIAFARQDDARFYYAHLGEKADGNHHQIHLVDHADRRAITASRTEGSPWQPGRWHRLKLVHDTVSGKIAVFFDDMEKPVLTAQDKTLDHGWIGLGSFDDLGTFRNLEIQGEKL
ncbi:MAG: hypothetical protein EXS37_21585 [Opitutus sp.]|nr:hypothetical protein [Opitutus sp.]